MTFRVSPGRLLLLVACIAAQWLDAPHAAATGVLTAYENCVYQSVTAQVSASSAVVYHAMGDCGGRSISATLSFDPRSHQYKEKFFDLVNFEDTGTCTDDPWRMHGICSGQLIRVQGKDSDIQRDLNPADAPFSRGDEGSIAMFRDAYAAGQPNPPRPPVNVAAQATLTWNQMRVQWLAPDESGNHPFFEFRLQVRPGGAEGAAWTTLKDVPRAAGPGYDVKVMLPPRVAGYRTWDVRACSLADQSQTCSDALTPAMASTPVRPAAQSSAALAQPGSGVKLHPNAQRNVGVAGSDPVVVSSAPPIKAPVVPALKAPVVSPVPVPVPAPAARAPLAPASAVAPGSAFAAPQLKPQSKPAGANAPSTLGTASAIPR
jgi:hypothetical protein